jgi:hypothetical protein
MIVYRTFSFVQLFLLLLFKIGYVAGIIVALYYYKENPVVMILIALICTLFLLVTGSDEIVVHSDYIEFTSNSFLKKLQSKKVFKTIDIKSISASGIYSTGDELHNPSLTKGKSFNQVVIKLKNGESITIKTNIYIDQLEKAVKLIKQNLD